MTIKHIVMFSFKVGTTNADIQLIRNALLQLPKQIVQIRDYEFGHDMLLKSGQDHPAGKNRLVSWSCTFDNTTDYETYATDLHHVNTINTFIKPHLEPGSRAAIQYEIEQR
jgi:Stress responsive A/B Barrel Domain